MAETGGHLIPDEYVKVMKSELVREPVFMEEWRREARAAWAAASRRERLMRRVRRLVDNGRHRVAVAIAPWLERSEDD